MKPIFTVNDLKLHFAEPIRYLLIDEDTGIPKFETYFEIIDGKKKKLKREVAQPYIDSAIEMIQAMGFHCVAEGGNIWKPIVAALAQSHLQQNANQNLSLPYSTIQIEYENAMKFLKDNPNICNNKNVETPFNMFASRRAKRVVIQKVCCCKY